MKKYWIPLENNIYNKQFYIMDQKFSVRDWKNKTLYKESYKEGEKLANRVQESNQEESIANFIIKYYTNPKTGKSLIDDEIIGDFFKTHPESRDQEPQDALDNFEEFLSVNYESGVDYMEENDEKEPSKSDIATAEKDLEFEIPKSTGASNNMRSIIVKKVAKIEKKRDDNDDYTMDLLALKQYIKKDDVRKEVGAKEIRNLVSPLIK